MVWKNLKIQNVSGIDKKVAEFTVWMVGVLPFAKMRIKIMEDQEGNFTGYTDIQLIRKIDGYGEAASGFGKTVDEALEETIKSFNEMIDEDYPELPVEGLQANQISYVEWNDF
jgi:Zn-finger domain-containing protein